MNSLSTIAADTRAALEDLFDQVWRCEADWRLSDRIDLAISVRSPQGMTPAGGLDEDAEEEGKDS